jgi:hypothetical protein
MPRRRGGKGRYQHSGPHTVDMDDRMTSSCNIGRQRERGERVEEREREREREKEQWKRVKR